MPNKDSVCGSLVELLDEDNRAAFEIWDREIDEPIQGVRVLYIKFSDDSYPSKENEQYREDEKQEFLGKDL